MSELDKLRLNGIEYDITQGIKEDIEELQDEIADVDALVGTGVIE